MKLSFMPSVNTPPFFIAMEEDQKSKHKCRFCHKIFPCGRSLGGHMRSHLLTISSTHNKKKKKLPILVHHNECGRSFQSWMEKDSWIHHHLHRPFIITDNNMSADNEAAAALWRKKKRSERTRRYTNSYSNMDQQEQEVAMSLILLSMDTSSESSEAKKTAAFSSQDSKSSGSEELDTEFRAPRKRLKSSEDSECEVTSPKTLIQKNGSSSGSDHTKKITNSEATNECKFSCVICKKGFPSYHALGGHRASHKKFKGCCAPASDHPAPDFQEKVDAGVECKKSKEHECPICFKVFPSGQALGGHKRSHLTGDQAQAKNTDPSVSTQTQITENRSFLDLNSPAPSEEDCNEFKTWWIGTSHSNLKQLLLGLLST